MSLHSNSNSAQQTGGFQSQFEQFNFNPNQDYLNFGVNDFDTGITNQLPNIGGALDNVNSGGEGGFFTDGAGGQGWGAAAIGAATGVAQTWMGFQQLKEGKRQNRIGNEQWQAQFDIQSGIVKRQQSERAARVAANTARTSAAGAG